MTTDNDFGAYKVTATIVADVDRLNFLPRRFGYVAFDLAFFGAFIPGKFSIVASTFWPELFTALTTCSAKPGAAGIEFTAVKPRRL